MAATGAQKPTEHFPFLDERTALEPFLYETLVEIQNTQKAFFAGKTTFLATRETIRSARSIRMPFTPARDKNLDYILELILHRFPMNFNRIVSFDFSFDDASKRIVVKEIEEFAINLTREQTERLTRERDTKSAESLNQLVAKFRIFNLSKLVAQTSFKQDINRIVGMTVNRTIFTYKNYAPDRGQIVATDEFCFHASNYEHIKKTLDIKRIMPILANHSEAIRTKLKGYGILSAEFSDYRDSKVDYILHIVASGLSGQVNIKDAVEARNFQSLRECILRVDKILDPARIYSADILRFIRENGFVTSHDIYANILTVTPDVLSAWSKKEAIAKEYVFKHADATGAEWYFDAPKLSSIFQDQFNFMRSDPARYAALPPAERDRTEYRMDALYTAGCALLAERDAAYLIKGKAEDLSALETLLDEYADYMRQKQLRREVSRNETGGKSGGGFSLIRAVAGIFKGIFSMFSRKDHDADDDVGSMASAAGSSDAGGSGARSISKETRALHRKTASARGPILALSEFIELTRENDHIVDKIISDMRAANLKIVMPVYNARTTLYPKRSAKVIIPDIEYLLIPYESILTPESITAYVDSLVGFKLRDDVLTGSMLVQIEKYLRTIQRQKKAMMKRK